MLKKLLNKLNGLHYPQEYLCLAKETFQQPLHMYLAENGNIIKDITHAHTFIGYSPLIIALHAAIPNGEHPPKNADILFTRNVYSENEIPERKDAVACLSLQLIRRQAAGNTDLLYYEGIKGEHRFVSGICQYIMSLYNRLYNKKPGNVFLHDNLYKQVQIAYAIPRTISLITVSDGHLFNLFPTDLHGAVNDQYYISSLRCEGKACTQVMDGTRIVISEVHCDTYKIVYALGKNHMQKLKPKESFPFSDAVSVNWQLPLPKDVIYYRELELAETFDHGIHKLLLYKIVHSASTAHGPATLAHIHNVYATWRYNKGLAGNYLLR